MRHTSKSRDKELLILVSRVNHYNETKVSNSLMFSTHYNDSIPCECVGDTLQVRKSFFPLVASGWLR